MKKKVLLIAISALFALWGCNNDDDNNNGNPEAKYDLGATTKAMYILNEGSYGGNSAGLTFLTADEVANDYFTKKNSRGLGDVANDMGVYGGKVYIVVNNSHTVEIISAATGVSLKQIACGTASPRQVAFDGGYAYVSCFNGDIMKIDTASMAVVSTMQVSGNNPDGIAIFNGKLYAANTGGLNYPNYDSTLSIINLTSFTEEEKITVGINPGQIIALGNNRILIAITGNYDDVAPSLKILNTETNVIERTLDIQSSGIALHNNVLYCYHYDYYTLQMSFARYDILNDRIDNVPFIGNSSKIKSPYGIAINEANGDIYIMDAVDMLGTNGTLYCFDKNGSPKFDIETGLLPSKVVFVR